MYPEVKLFIDGEWLPCAARDSSPVINPATGDEIGRLPHACTDDLNQALAAADRSFTTWRVVSAHERANIIKRAAGLLRQRLDAVAQVMTLEQGKPLAESRVEVSAAADVFEWFAEEGRRVYGRLVPSRSPDIDYQVRRQPVGPVAAFSPWNFPAVIPARKIAASLASGCTCIIKPAEETPGTCLELARALHDAGLPNGVLNVVTGLPATISEHLLRSKVIRKLSFTGSTTVGKHLGALANASMIRTTLELGGHAPVLVFKDADLEQAVTASVVAKFRNAGQVCISPTRFYVEDAIHDAFVERFAKLASALVVGDGMKAGVQLGPLANGRRPAAMRRHLEDAVQRGARVATGGEALSARGFFHSPTLLADVPDAALSMNEEPFGPLALTARFDRTEQALQMANRLPFGLAAYAFTKSLRTVRELSEGVECGMLGINNFAINFPETPFGGVKESGHGSEGGSEGMDGYLNTKLVSIAS